MASTLAAPCPEIPKDSTMRRPILGGALAIVSAVALVWSVSLAPAQSGSRGPAPAPQQQRSRLTPRQFQEAFWSFLKNDNNGYLSWTSWPGRNGMFAGQPPHGAFVKLYANRAAAFSPRELPLGSILVQEEYAQDKQTLQAVTVMYRAPGFDSGHNDWYWIQYTPEGAVAKTSPETGAKLLAGAVANCITCHRKAMGGDWVHANDE